MTTTKPGSAPSHPSVVEHVPLDALRPDPANPRRINEAQLDALTRSMRTYGIVQPVLARREDGVVIGGHQRLVAARRLGMTEVPVIWLDLDIGQAHLLNLALNRISGDWDEQLLARLLNDLGSVPDIDLNLSGFGEDEVDVLLRKLDVAERADRVEDFDLETALEDAGREPRTRPGDLWLLGEHRLMCGDATDAATVERLLGEARPRLLSTDPPYGVSLDPRWRDGVHNKMGPAEKPYMQLDADDGEAAVPHRRTKGHRNTTISGDTRVDWSEAFALVPSIEVGYVWHAGVHAAAVAAGLVSIGFEIVSQVIWDKTLFAMGRSWYHWAHEPCWVVRRKGARPRFDGTRDQSTIWRAPSPKMIMGGSKEARFDHPAQKPALLSEIPLRNHTRPGDAVYDPFLGSGTTLMAAERLSRACLGMEIEPRYADVIVARWERFSGRTAVRLDG